jgi:uncharacterized protein YlaI
MTSMIGRVRTRFNTEFDSRILRVSMGALGMTRPRVVANGLERVYCLNCGTTMGAVSEVIPIQLRNVPGVITICGECEHKVGTLPAQAIGYERVG